MIVRKDSKSLKVFIAFIFDIYPIHFSQNKAIDFVVSFMEQPEGKKMLVTGGAGFIGFHLCKKLLDFTPHVTIYDNLSSGKLENVKDLKKAIFIKGDILDLRKLCSLEKTDTIFHLAAQVVVPYSMDNPIEDFETNAHGTLNVLEKARKDDAQTSFCFKRRGIRQSYKVSHSRRIWSPSISLSTAYPKWSAKITVTCIRKNTGLT